MEGGSVRDRIRAAELARQQAEGESSSPISPRRGPKFALKSDEHVKEEFLKKGDGGWTKNVNIGQMAPFTIPKNVPAIQVTKVETPVVAEREELPGKIVVPGAFEAGDELEEKSVPLMKARHSASKAARALPKTQTAPKTKATPSKQAVKAAPPLRKISESAASPKSDSKLETQDKPKERAKTRSHSREPPVAAPNKGNGRALRKASREVVGSEAKPASKEVREARKEKKASHSGQRPPRPAAKREERLSVNYADSDEEEHHTDRQPSRSRSRHPEKLTDEGLAHERSHSHRRPSHHSHIHDSDEQLSAPESPRRRSSHSLWPSFFQSQRRSISDLMEGVPTSRPRNSRSRTNSDDHSSTAKPPSSPRKEIGFMEYVSGKKLDYLPDAAMKPKPSERMGYVRSKSSTGGYFEHFTRDKRLLRKPSEDELLEHSDHDGERRIRHGSRPDVADQRKDEPWQVKLARELVKR